MCANSRSHDKSGFALVDVLVGLAVLGLIGSLLTSVLSLAVRQHRQASAIQRIGEASFAVSRLLHGLAGGTVLVHDRSLGWHSVQGKARELTVVSTGPPILALGAPTRFALKQEKGTRGYDLVMSWADPVSAQERSEVVLADVLEISFSYFAGAEKRWSPATGRSGGIEAVRLTIRFAAKADPVDIIANLPARLPASCAADPAAAYCKGWIL